MRINYFLITLILIVTVFQYQAVSQDPHEYKIRGTRMEGRDRKPVSAPGLELLSFVGYKEKIDLAKEVNLKIRFYLLKDTSVYITAKELNIREFYKMKPLQIQWSKGWQEFGPWPTKEVLKPLQLSLNKLGIIGRVRSNDRIGSGEIAPLIIYGNQLPEYIRQYTLHFIPNQDLKKVEYKLYMLGEEKPIKRERIMEQFGGVPFSITIDLTNQDKGLYKLVLDCKYKNRIGGPQRTYTFYHNPIVEQ